jgi:hypothetical protein
MQGLLITPAPDPPDCAEVDVVAVDIELCSAKLIGRGDDRSTGARDR